MPSPHFINYDSNKYLHKLEVESNKSRSRLMVSRKDSYKLERIFPKLDEDASKSKPFTPQPRGIERYVGVIDRLSKK